MGQISRLEMLFGGNILSWVSNWYSGAQYGIFMWDIYMHPKVIYYCLVFEIFKECGFYDILKIFILQDFGNMEIDYNSDNSEYLKWFKFLAYCGWWDMPWHIASKYLKLVMTLWNFRDWEYSSQLASNIQSNFRGRKDFVICGNGI